MTSEMTRKFLDAILPKDRQGNPVQGHLTGGVGHGGHFDTAGKYIFARFAPFAFHWPNRADDAVDHIQAHGIDCDVYICPYLMKTPNRRKGDAAWRALAHSDLDGADVGRAYELGGFALRSGTANHWHAYFPLTYTLRQEQHERLLEGLTTYLGGDRSKVRDNDLLRPAGVFNLKPSAAGGSPGFVMPERPYDVPPLDPIELGHRIGVDLTKHIEQATPTKPPSVGTGRGREPVDLGDFPAVRDAASRISGDRSDDTWYIISTCRESGLTLPQTRWVIDQRVDLTERVNEFLARTPPVDDVAQSWAKTQERNDSVLATHDSTKTPTDGFFSDARMAVYIAERVFAGKFIWVRGIGWLTWTGKVWRDCGDGPPTEAIRAHVEERVIHWARRLPDAHAEQSVKNWLKLASRARIVALRELGRNRVDTDVSFLDSDPDLLNTPGGVVHLPTGSVVAHDQRFGMTRMTRGSLRPGFTHPDVNMAMLALNPSEHEIFLNYIGQGITGHRAHEDITILLHGEGGNGKSALVGFGFMTAFGDYAHHASTKLFVVSEKGSDHSTEMADLRGRRFVLGEELQEEARLNIAAIKKLSTARITARRVFENNIEFTPTHTLMLSSNPLPAVTETDDGTWRRLKRIHFPYRFVESEEHIENPYDRVGDMGLRRRLEEGSTGQHDALVTLAVKGAMRWYADPKTAMKDTPQMAADTMWWREQNDRILRYWRECLISDPDTAVRTSVMREHFNEWSKIDGHINGFTRATFVRKFLGHRETRKHGVIEKKIRPGTTSLSYPSHNGWVVPQTVLPKQLLVFNGVRYRTVADELSAPFTLSDEKSDFRRNGL